MKSQLRIPTKQQYAYIEVEFEGKPQEIVDMYFDVSQRYWEKQRAHDMEKAQVKANPPFEGDEHAGGKTTPSTPQPEDYLNKVNK